MSFESSKVLVTGGAGLIGSHIVDELVREGTKVVVYDNFTRGTRDNLEWALKNGDVTIIEGDICDLGSLIRAFKGIDYVFHEAAEWKKICQQYPRKALDINVVGTFNVLEACVIQGVKKIVAASSSAVYGDGRYFPTDENHPFDNSLFYGASKIALEQFLKCFYKQYGLNFVGFRYLNVYGPRQLFYNTYSDVFMIFLNLIDENQSPVIDGDGSQTVDPIFVKDVARANVLAMKSLITNELFNLTAGKETTLKELVELIIDIMGKKGKIQPIYRARDSKWVSRMCGSYEKTEEMLGFRARVSLREGLTKTLDWMQEWKHKYLKKKE